MAAKKPKKQTTIAIAATQEDLELFEAIKAKTGLSNAGVIRMSIRQFAEDLKVQVA